MFLAVTVSSLARRLSMFFFNDVIVGDSASSPLPSVSFKHHSLPTVEQQDEVNAKDSLLPPHSHDTLSGPTDCPSTPADFSSSVGYGSFSSSPFVVVGEAQVEVGVDDELMIEEAVLLGKSPLKRELSLSMLGCREGVYSPEFFPSVEERPSTPLPPLEDRQDMDHSYAVPCVVCKPVQSTPVQEAILPPKTADTLQSPEREVCFQSRAGNFIVFETYFEHVSFCAQCVIEEIAILPEQALKLSEKSKLNNSEPAKSEVLPAIKIPRFDTCSPSQAVFKPQWLGVGFGATGVRARGVQSRVRGPSSPLSARRPANDENENKVVLKQKQRGKLSFVMHTFYLHNVLTSVYCLYRLMDFLSYVCHYISLMTVISEVLFLYCRHLYSYWRRQIPSADPQGN